MRKLIIWALVALGIAALVRKLRRRGEQTEPVAVGGAGDPAEELRRKLADSHPATTESGEPPSAPTSIETTVEERRAEVHDEGRSAIDEMRGSSPED